MLEIKFNGFPVLESERMMFQQICAADATDIFELRTNEKVIKYSDRDPMKNMQEAMDKVKLICDTFDNNNGVAWSMKSKETKRTIGHISFWRIIKEHHRAEIGYEMFPEYWGKGFMTEAINRVIDYGFSEIRFHSIEANVNPNNLPSIKLLERAGFVREAYFKENYYSFKGKFVDSAIYSLINNNDHGY